MKIRIPIPETGIKIVITTEKEINDLVNQLIREKRKAIFDEGYRQGRCDLARIVKAHFEGIDLNSNVRMVPVSDLPPYQDQPKEEKEAASS